MSFVAEGFDPRLKLDPPCPKCETRNSQKPFRITLQPMKVICVNCGTVLIGLTDEEESDLQEKVTEETGIPIGGDVCGQCTEDN